MNSSKKNPSSKIVRFVCIALTLALFLPATAHAVSSCGDTREIQKLVTILEKKVWSGESLSLGEALAVSNRLSAVKLSNLLPRLAESERTSERRAVLLLLQEAADIPRYRRVLEPQKLQRHLKAVERILATTCRDASLAVSEDRSISGAVSNTLTAKDLSAFFDRSGTLLKISLLLSFLLVLIAIVLALQALQRIVHTFVYGRKSCRVKAAMEFGVDIVDGYITVLGKNGCRFEPINAGALARVKKLVGHSNPSLIVLSFKLPLKLNGVAENYVSAFFESSINTRTRDTILSRSIIAPEYVKRSVMKSNIQHYVSG